MAPSDVRTPPRKPPQPTRAERQGTHAEKYSTWPECSRQCFYFHFRWEQMQWRVTCFFGEKVQNRKRLGQRAATDLKHTYHFFLFRVTNSGLFMCVRLCNGFFCVSKFLQNVTVCVWVIERERETDRKREGEGETKRERGKKRPRFEEIVLTSLVVIIQHLGAEMRQAQPSVVLEHLFCICSGGQHLFRLCSVRQSSGPRHQSSGTQRSGQVMVSEQRSFAHVIVPSHDGICLFFGFR